MPCDFVLLMVGVVRVCYVGFGGCGGFGGCVGFWGCVGFGACVAGCNEKTATMEIPKLSPPFHGIQHTE